MRHNDDIIIGALIVLAVIVASGQITRWVP